MNTIKGLIWKEVDDAPRKKIRTKFIRRDISIMKVPKEKTLNNESTVNNTTILREYKVPTFIKKKKGRKSKESNEYSTHDKFSNDNLKRKVKTHFHSYLIALLNNELHKNPLNDKAFRFGKINSKITQNITIAYNRNLFEKKIKDVIVVISNKYHNKTINSQCIKYIMNNQTGNEELIKYLNMTYKEMYTDLYLKSTKESFFGSKEDESYERHKEKFKSKFGEFYLKKYIKNADNLILFYETGKQRQSKKIKDNSFDRYTSKLSKSMKNIYNTKSNYLGNIDTNIYIRDEEDIDKLFLKHNKISAYTQTNKIFIDDESD